MHATVTETGRRVESSRTHPAIVGLVAAITYTNSVANGFALDDVRIIAENARVHQLADQAAIWLTPYWPQAGEQLGLYRPLAIFGYALQWVSGGGAPWVFHGISILMHVVATILVLALLRRLASPDAALLGALLFAVHPVHTEAVANVVGQAEMIAAIAVLGACVIHAGRPRAGEAGGVRLAAICVLYAAGLMAKEHAVVLPGLLVAIDAGQRRIGQTRAAVMRYARANVKLAVALASVLALYAGVRILVLGSFGGSNAAPAFEYLRGSSRALVAARVWPEYVRLLLFPRDLSADYSPAVISPPGGLSAYVVAGALILAGTVFLAATTFRRPERGLPFAWFLIAVLPAAHLIIPIGVVLAERTLYLPSVGLSLGVAFGSDFVRSRTGLAGRRIAVAAAFLVLAGLGLRSAVRNPDWRSTRTIWDVTARDHPESYKSQWWRSIGLYNAGDVEMSRTVMAEAVDIWPYDYELLTNLAGLHIELGELEAARTALAEAWRYGSVSPRTALLGAWVDLLDGRYADAIEDAEQAERLGAAVPANVIRGAARRALDLGCETEPFDDPAVPAGRVRSCAAILSDLPPIDGVPATRAVRPGRR